jgi:RHS repeat-associated protein
VNNSTAEIAGSLTDYHNNAATPIDVYASANDSSSTTQPLPQVTTTGNAETVMHIVGYNSIATSGAGPSAPPGDTTRANLNPGALYPSLVVSDLYQGQPGLSTAVSASSTTATASEAITVALSAATSTARLGYQGQRDSSTFTQTTTGTTIGTSIDLPAGINMSTTPAGTVWSYSNSHGDTITTTDNSGNLTWSGYWGPYGENASGTSPPTNTALSSATFGYNGAQNKLTDSGTGLTIMGARPYQAAYGRFLQPDPIQGGCANLYTYAFGDPLNHPDLSGKGLCPATEEVGISYTSRGVDLDLGTDGIAGAVAAAWVIGSDINGHVVDSIGQSVNKWCALGLVGCAIGDALGWSPSVSLDVPQTGNAILTDEPGPGVSGGGFSFGAYFGSVAGSYVVLSASGECSYAFAGDFGTAGGTYTL